MAGISLSQAELTAAGIRYDRAWMVIDENRRFVTQRQHPEMALVSAVPEPSGLTLTIPGRGVLSVPLVGDDAGEGAVLSVTIWNDTVRAVDQGDFVAEELTQFLGRPVRLVYLSEQDPRTLGASYPSPPGIRVGFADSSPLHLVGEASLADLNSHLERPVPMDRFRPNIVVTGSVPFEEDHWTRLRIAGVTFIVVKDCIRCQMVNVDQKVGVKEIDPLETLGTYRSGPTGIRFGRKVVHESPGWIKVGDPVDVLGAVDEGVPGEES